MWNDDDRKWLYEQMKKYGVNTGSYDDFTKSLDNKEDRDWYYKKSLSLGLNVGSADDFASMMVQPVQQPAPAPAPAQPVVKQTTGQVNPTVNTSMPKHDEQPQKQGGWQPTWQEKMGMQMQLDETMRQVKQSQQDFNTRMQNIRKGNTLGKTSEVKFNPESGRMERRYYTTTGEEVGSQWEQSRINLAERDRWESTTEEGRRHREKRIQNDFERRVGASLDKYDPDNAAAMAWQQAEERTKADREKHNDEIWSNYAAMGGGREMRMMETGDTWHSNMVDHLNYHDLQRMADDAWNMLGKEKQQSIIEDMYGALKNLYPQATEEQLQQAATEMAREQSDRRMFEFAVEKNAPKSATEYFFRKAIGMNSLLNIHQALARSAAGTTGDWEAREDAEQRFDKQGHKVARIAGTVTGFALDPLTWLSAGAGGTAVKGTTWLGGKMIGEAAMRKFGTTLGGRMLGGAIGGAVNFGTYEAGSEALDQMKWGGYIDEETGERKDGFSFGNVAGRAGHGLMMGAVTGVIAPYLGNVSDKLVRATESTIGKMGIRAGELGVGTVAEGTIFAVPEIIDTYGQYGDLINSLSDESSPNYIADEQERAAKIDELRNSRGDALMDVWTDNMAMIAGFKAQHLLKSAPRVIYDLARSKNGKAGFETRLRSILDGRGDLALTEDEKKELERRGYADLKDLSEEYSRYAEAKEEYDKARPTTTDASRMIEGGDGQAELPYNRFVELMTDNSVSEAARAKMYYYLTGHGLPMSTVMGSSILEDKDADGNMTGYTVQSFGANGVITSRSFGDKKRADVEVNRINRQAELNGFDVGERYYDWQGDNKRMYEACETVAEETGAPANLLFDLMKRKTEAMNEVELEWAEKILNAYNGLGDKYGSSEVRTAINEEFGVDVDKAIRKERNRRSEQEQKAVDEYASRLFADVKRKQEEAAERGEAPSSPDAPTSNSQIAALLGINDGEQGDPVSAAFNRGHEADAQERQDISIELADPNNAEAQEAWNGVVQRINEDAAYMVAQQREQTKKMQHTDGSLRPAILKEKDSDGNDQQVYIVDGNVQMMPDGSVVDKASSDNIVVIYNPATGERKQIDPSADTGISSLGEVTTAEQREADIERSRQEYVQAQIDEAQGTVRLSPGQQLILPTGEEAVVVATDADGGNITVALGDGTQATVQRSELQRIRDEKGLADYRKRHGITEEPAAQQPEASMPAQPQADGRVAGAPADYTADMELTIRDEDGIEKPAMVMGRVRYENGSFVPDANGNIIEYFMDGEVKHDHEDKLVDKVVSHVAPAKPEADTAPTATETQSQQADDERVIRDGIAGVGEGLRDAVNEQAASVRENDINNWLQNPTVADAMRKYGDGAQSVEEVVQRALADNPNDETKAALGDIMRFDSSKQLVQGYISQPQPAKPAEAPLQTTEQPKEEPMPVGEDGEEDWQATTPERAHTYIFNEAGLTRSEGNEFIAAQIQAAQAALRKASSANLPKIGTSINKYNEAKAKRQGKIDEAQRVLDYWNGVREIQNAIQREENERRAADDAVRHDEAVAAAQAEYEARKQAEEERKAVGNENPMPAITEKWNNATKVDGHSDEIMLPDGTPLKGHYVLHESGASSPSHNPETWQKTDGFPMDANDNSVNDRDYERDHDAQEHTQSIARQYDQRALQSVPVVSNDGVVLSGNGRTMAGQLAARDNTDSAYVNYLKEYAPKFGFTPEQVEAMKHPRVSFVPDEAMPYTAETFAKFNQQDMKSQNKTEQAVKLGKTVGDDVFKGIVRTINGYDTLGDFYNDADASLGAVYDLHNAGVVPQAQLAEMVDGIRGQEKLSAVGREFLENMLIGKAFEGDPDVVRMLTSEPSMRQSVITALGEIADNIAIGGGWSLQQELADAVKLCFDARKKGAKQGDIVSIYARQGVLFADPDQLQTVADFNNATMLMLADVLNDKRVTLLKITLQLYNNHARESAAGQTDLFAGGIRSREDILRDVINFINNNYGKRKEIDAARAAAVERRKAESVQQDGSATAGSGGSENTGGSGRNETAVSAGLRITDPRTMSDEERQRRGEMLRDATAIDVAPNHIVSTKDKTARKAAEEWWDDNVGDAQWYETEAGEVEINRNSIESSLAHGYGQMKLDAITSLVDGFSNAVYLGTMPDSTRQDGVLNHYFAYPINYKGKRSYVFCRALHDNNTNRLYVHEVFVEDKIKKGNTIQTAASQPHGGISLYRDILANVLLSDGKESENSASDQAKGEKIAETQGASGVQAALEAAEQETNTEPTEAQKKAGNYKMGHVRIDGFDVTIENPKGSVRRGTDASGKQWEQEMQNTYGYIRGTEGVDGDHIDVFFSDDPSQGDVFVVDQMNKDGSFDEHKVMYGFPDIESARKAYLSNYEDGWQGLGAITPVSKEEFKKWIDSSRRKTKPFAEYSSVKPLGDTQLGEQPTAGYSIEQTTYTNKKGKTTPMHLVTFGRELSKDEIRAGKELAKESRGWWDREKRGFMMRDEDSAKALAEALSNEEAVQDAQPLSVEDISTVSDQADMKAASDAIKIEQEPQTTPQYDYDREDSVYDTVLSGLREALNNRKVGSIPNIKAIEKEIRDLRKRAKAIEDGMATAAGETIPQAFDALANLNGKRRAYEQFLVDIRKKMAETERDDALAAHGVKLGDKIMYKGKEATIHDADARQVTLDVDMAPVLYEVTDWENVEVPKREPATQQPKKVNVESFMGEIGRKGKAKLSDHTEEPQHEESTEQPKQEEKKAKSKWVDDADAERFEELRRRLRQKLGGQLNMGLDPEAFAIGVEMSYLMLKHGSRKFAEFARNLIEALGEGIRPYVKTLYNGARDLPEMADIEKDMTPWDEVRTFDVMNFDKEGAKDVIATAEHIVREQAAEREAKEATDRLKQQRNEQRKESEQEVAANTAALASEAATVASETESKLPSARSEREVNDLAKSIDDAIDKVNDQLALLGYYEAEPVESDFNEAYGYMRNAEKKAVKNVTELFKTLTKELGISDPVVYDTKGKKQKSVTANIAPAGGDVTMRFMLNRDKGVELYIDFMLEPDYENNHDNLVLKGIMYRPERNLPNGGRDYLRANNFFPVRVTLPQMLQGIRSVCQEWLPKEDYVAMAQRIAARNTGNQQEKPSKEHKSKKKTVSSQKQTMPDLFSGLFGEDELNSKSNDTARTYEAKGSSRQDGTVGSVPADRDRVLDTASTRQTDRGETARVSDEAGAVADGERGELPSRWSQGGATRVDNVASETGQPLSDGGRSVRDGAASNGRGHDNRAAAATSDGVPSQTGAGSTGGRREQLAERRVRATKQPEPKFTRNYLYPEDASDIDNMTPQQRLMANVEALEVVRNLMKEGREATPEEREILGKYRGWGGVELGRAYSTEMMRRSFTDRWGTPTEQGKLLARLADVIDELDPNGERGVLSAINRAALTSYYTPTGVAKVMNRFAELAGFKGGTMLDPSMGNGIFEGTMSKAVQQRTMIHGVELDWLTGQIARNLYPDANVLVTGYQDAGTADNAYDVVMSNIPFGDFSVTDKAWKHDSSPVRKAAQNRIHNYFAVKMLDNTRPGGLCVIMTSNAILDTNGNQIIREYIADNSEVLGVVRLPDNTFKGAGTSVVTDVIFLRKYKDDTDRSTKRSDEQYLNNIEKPFLTSGELQLVNKTDGKSYKVAVNGYFTKNKGMMIGDAKSGGQYRADQFGLGSDMSTDELAAAMQKLVEKKIVGDRKGKLFDTHKTVREVKQAVSEAYKGDGRYISSGNIVEQDGMIGVVAFTKNKYGDVNSTFTEMPELKGKANRVRAMLPIRKAMKQVIDWQIQGLKESDLAQARAELQKAYDDFKKKFGRLNIKENDFLTEDIDGYTMRSLEKWKDGKFVGLSDIFTKNTIKPALDLSTAKTPQEAISLSLAEYGEINSAFMEDVLGESWAELCGETLFKEPFTTDSYLTADAYLSGDVKSKLEQAREAAKEDKALERNVKALEAVQPKDIPFDEISIRMGARWIPSEMYTDFMYDMFGIHKNDWKGNKSGVEYMPELDQYVVNVAPNELGGEADQWRTSRRSASEVFTAAMQDKSLSVFDTIKEDGKETKILNKEETELLNGKIQDLRTAFEDWLSQNPEREEALMRLYNDKFNRTVLRKFDGSHLRIPGLMGMELRPHQKDAVWMLVNNRGGIVDHIVGAGKTLVMQSAIMEMRRMGIAKKPMIIGLKATCAQIAKEFREAFPAARILAPTERDFSKENRKKFMSQIALNDYDCVILSHDQYCMLPHTEEVERGVIDEQMAQLNAAIEFLYGQSDKNQLTKKQIKGLEKRKANLEAKLASLLDRKIDREFTFEGLGVDYLFVDECQHFKSLPYVSTYDRVAGLGDKKGSQRAISLLNGVRYLQKMHQGDRGTVFLSGTTISNSLSEIYHLLNYLRPSEMEKLGMTTFDAWAGNYAIHTAELEYGVTNELKEKDRFRSLTNIPELSKMYAEIADVRNDMNLKLPKPKMRSHIVTVPQSDLMREINAEIVNMVRNKDGHYFGIDSKDTTPWGLLASTLSAKAAINPRLIDDAYEDEEGKIPAVCEQVKKIYDQFNEQKGTQLIFCDTGVSSKGKKYDAYSDIINRLVNDYGIPRSEIADIHIANTDEKRKALFAKVNEGSVRILIGGTKNMGTGVNVQKHIVAMHHVDVPWTPADREQREGRGVRQGNEVARDFNDDNVDVYFYATEGSLDMYKYQLQETKGKLFAQFKSGTIGERTFDEGDAEGDFDPAEVVAMLSGNPVIFEKSKQDKKVEKLRRSKRAYESDWQRRRSRYEELQTKKRNFERLISLNASDVRELERGGFIPDGEGKFPTAVTVQVKDDYASRRTFDKPKEAGEYIHSLLKQGKKVQLSGFNQKANITVPITDAGLFGKPVAELDSYGGIKYTVEVSDDNTAAGVSFRNLLQKVYSNKKVYERNLEEVNNQLNGADPGENKFPKQAELDEALKEKKRLDDEYKKLSDEKPKADEEDGEITKDGDMYRDGEYDDDIEQDSTMQEDRDMMRSAVQQMGEKLHTIINIIEDVNEITHPNAEIQEQRRRAKGWYDKVTRLVYVVLHNNRDVDDVKATTAHETIAHKGLRELVGEENYDEFLDQTYQHLRDELKKGVDAAAGRAFINDTTKNGKRAKSYEQHRRTAVDELFGRLAEKPFEEFSEGERTLWQKIKEAVRKVLDKFLGTLKLPKWFELGDNELRYILWRSKERLERGREHPIDLARDIVKREELGLTDEARYNMGDDPETFKARQRRAVENKGTVMPGLNDAQVKVVDVPRHHYTGNIAEATRQAIEAAKAKFAPNGKARTLRYDNFGATFDYSISGSAVEESLNPKQQAKSVNKGVHIAMAEHLDEIIGQSIEVEEHPDYLKNEKGERDTSIINDKALMHRFYGAVVVDGVPYRVMTLMREDRRFNEGNAVHAYEVQKIEVLDEETPNTPNGSHTSKVNALVPVAVAKVIKNVEKSYDTGKKLLDESKMSDESTDLYRDPDDTDDVWTDGSLGLQERITAAATRLANNHRDNKTLRNDAMRAIGGNLSDLRKAMSLQRTFDMTTVKRVADLARVLMNNGYLNGLTQQEVKRLLAAIKNSVGHNDIEGDVQKVMDIMVDNQLKHAEETLRRLEAIKGSKVDARGVEVQGQLDPAGAHTMKVFKKTRGWEKTDIEEAISEAQQRMGSSDVAVADEAALEYTGLQLALEYAENIKDSKVEERKLREEIKQEHDGASERDRATDSYRQYIASVEEAIRQNKIERAQSYFDLVGRLSDSLRESIANAKNFKEAEKQRIREIQHNANSDMEGRPSDEHYKPTFADKFVNNSFVSFLFAPLATFDQMLRMFGGKSANGEGYLYNRFMRGWVDARQKEINGVRDKYAILDAKAADLFGGKVKTWGDLIRRVGKLPKGTVSFWNGGEMQERELTQGNLMYIYMVNKMLDGRMKLRKMGITEENVADIEEVLDPRLIELADWLQDEFLVETRNEYNETHKRMFGASMAAIEHYFPLKILANARADKPEDLDNPDKSDGIGTATGSIIKRRRNALALDITGADALSVILDHVAQMEHWNAFAEFNRDINTLRTYKRFRNQVQNMTTIYGSGKELWKKFNDVCQMAAGTYRPPRTKLDEAAVNFAKGVTAAKVSFRMFTALKQFLSMPAYIPEARTDYLLRNIANPVGAWKWSMEHLPIFNERWRSRMSGDPRLLKSDMDWKMWRTRIMQLASRAGMSPNAFVDALTVSIGAHSMYQTRLAQYLRDGYSEADAEKKAVQDAEVLYNQTQQSSEGAFTSTMQVDRSWLSVLFTVFRNASMSYQRQLHDALRNFKHNLTPGGRARSIEFMKKQYVRDGIDEAQAEQNATRKFRRQLLKDTLRVATFGYIMQLAWNLGAYLPYLLFGDDEDEKQKMWDDVWAHTTFGSVEGLTGGDLMSQAGQMMLTGEGNPAYLSKDMPLTSDIMAAFQKLGNGQHTEALNDMINLIVQAGLGVNPQSITDVALAIMDACGDDPALAHEATICISRILQVPQSQIDKMYFDEVGLSGEEVSKYTPAQLAERYAQFKVKRGRFFSPWSWDDEERIKKFTDKANKTIKERTEQMGDKHVNEAYLQYEEVYKGVDAKVKEAKKMAKTDYVEVAQLMAEAQSDPNAFATYQMFKQMDGNFNKIVKLYLGAKTPDEAALCRQAVLDYKSAMVRVLEAPDAATRAEAMGNLGNVMQEFTQKYVPMQQPNR